MSTNRAPVFIVESFDAADPSPMAGVLFAEDFEPISAHAAASGIQAPPAPQPITQADVEVAQAAAFTEGMEAARAELQSRARLAEAAACQALAQSLADQAEAGAQASAAAAECLARVVMQVFADLLPELCVHHGPAEVARLTATILPMLALEPALVIRANPHTLPALRRVTASLDNGGEARVTLIGTDALHEADVVIEWKHGTLRRNTVLVLDQLRVALAELGVALPGTAAATLPQPADTHIKELADA